MNINNGVGFGIGDNSATLNLFQETGGPRLIMQVSRDYTIEHGEG